MNRIVTILVLISLAVTPISMGYSAVKTAAGDQTEMWKLFGESVTAQMKEAIAAAGEATIKETWRSPTAKAQTFWQHTCERLRQEYLLRSSLERMQGFRFTWQQVGVNETLYMAFLERIARDARGHLKEVFGYPRHERRNEKLQCDFDEESFNFGSALSVAQQFVWTWGAYAYKAEIMPLLIKDLQAHVRELREAVLRPSITRLEAYRCMYILATNSEEQWGIPLWILGFNAEEQEGIKNVDAERKQKGGVGCYSDVLVYLRMPRNLR